jgi:hypothetical protein
LVDATMQTAGYGKKAVDRDVYFYYSVAEVWTNIDSYKFYMHYYL